MATFVQLNVTLLILSLTIMKTVGSYSHEIWVIHWSILKQSVHQIFQDHHQHTCTEQANIGQQAVHQEQRRGSVQTLLTGIVTVPLILLIAPSASFLVLNLINAQPTMEENIKKEKRWRLLLCESLGKWKRVVWIWQNNQWYATTISPFSHGIYQIHIDSTVHTHTPTQTNRWKNIPYRSRKWLLKKHGYNKNKKSTYSRIQCTDSISFKYTTSLTPALNDWRADRR